MSVFALSLADFTPRSRTELTTSKYVPSTTTIAAPFRLPSARAYLDFVRSSASPIQQILAALPPAAEDAAWAEIEQRLDCFSTDDGWSGPNELLLTVARR